MCMNLTKTNGLGHYKFLLQMKVNMKLKFSLKILKPGLVQLNVTRLLAVSLETIICLLKVPTPLQNKEKFIVNQLLEAKLSKNLSKRQMTTVLMRETTLTRTLMKMLGNG